MLQEMRGKAMSQRVRRNILDARLFRVSLDHGPRKLPRERPPAIQKNVWRRLFPITRSHRCILLQPVNGTLAQGHAAFLVPFAVTNEEPREEIDIHLLQTNQLRNSQPSGIHDFQYRAIPDTFFGSDIWRRKQAIDLILSEKLRQVTEALRRIQILSRMRPDMSVEH